MNDDNSITAKLVNLAETKGFLTSSDIEEVLPIEFNLEELDDLVSSIIEMGIHVRDDESPNNSKTGKIDTENNILINSHIYLVHNIVKEHLKTKPYTMGGNDLVQEGYLGLLTAATDYKQNGSDSFPMFASKIITNFIEKAIENEKSLRHDDDHISLEYLIDNEKKLRHDDDHISLEYLYKKNEYIRYWKDDDEDIYTTKFSDQSKSVDKDQSEVTLTSISKIQLPQIPDFDKVTPSLTSDDMSILVEKKNISENKNFRTNRPKYVETSSIEDITMGMKGSPSTTDDPLPKVYSKVRFDSDRRLSLYARLVGERAEKVVLKYLGDTLMPSEGVSLRWISKSGETPGWDIEYYDSDRNMVAIEVKGTNGKNFPNIEITGNEWNAAVELRDQYWIYLVSDCLGTNPKIQRLQNPFKLKETGLLKTTPILWRIEMISSSTRQEVEQK